MDTITTPINPPSTPQNITPSSTPYVVEPVSSYRKPVFTWSWGGAVFPGLMFLGCGSWGNYLLYQFFLLVPIVNLLAYVGYFFAYGLSGHEFARKSKGFDSLEEAHGFMKGLDRAGKWTFFMGLIVMTLVIAALVALPGFRQLLLDSQKERDARFEKTINQSMEKHTSSMGTSNAEIVSLAKSDNASKKANLNAILNALLQCKEDNGGLFTEKSNKKVCIATQIMQGTYASSSVPIATNTSRESAKKTSITSLSFSADLCPLVKNGYIAALPLDPTLGAAENSKDINEKITSIGMKECTTNADSIGYYTGYSIGVDEVGVITVSAAPNLQDPAYKEGDTIMLSR